MSDKKEQNECINNVHYIFERKLGKDDFHRRLQNVKATLIKMQQMLDELRKNETNDK